MRLLSMCLRKYNVVKWDFLGVYIGYRYHILSDKALKETFLLTVIFMHRKIRRRLLLSVVVLCLLSGRTQKSKEEYVSCIQSLLFVVCILSVIVVVKAEAAGCPTPSAKAGKPQKGTNKTHFFPAFSASSSRVPASLATEMSKIGLPEDDRGAGLFLAMPASFLVRSK